MAGMGMGNLTCYGLGLVSRKHYKRGTTNATLPIPTPLTTSNFELFAVILHLELCTFNFKYLYERNL
jgi:hypothetical protein